MGRLFKLLFRAYSAKKFLGYFGTLGRRAGFLRQAVVLFYCTPCHLRGAGVYDYAGRPLTGFYCGHRLVG